MTDATDAVTESVLPCGDTALGGVDRPGKSGGRYVCELSLILADSSAL